MKNTYTVYLVGLYVAPLVLATATTKAEALKLYHQQARLYTLPHLEVCLYLDGVEHMLASTHA